MPTVAETVNSYAELLGSGSAEQITALYAPDASVEDPVGSGVRNGHAEIRELYSRVERQSRTVELLSVHINGNEAAFLARLTVVVGDVHTSDRRHRCHDVRRAGQDHVHAGVLVDVSGWRIPYPC